jgi:hypothetical protein
MWPTRRLALPISLLLTSCGGSAASNLARAVVDTLPGGIPRVTSSGPTAWTDAAGASLVEEVRFSGEDGTPSEIGQPQSLAVDEDGRVYVVDSKPAVIKVFTPDGSPVRNIGREGEGPGEFRVGFIAVRGGHVVIQDPELGRMSVWDTAGVFIRSWHSSCCYHSDIQIDRQNRIHVPSAFGRAKGKPPRGVPYVRWSLEGDNLDSVWVPHREATKVWKVSIKGSDGDDVMAMVLPIPLQPDVKSALHPDGGIVHGWTGAYWLTRSPAASDSARVFGRLWTPEAISDERRTAAVEAQVKQVSEGYGEANARRAFSLADVPPTLPAFAGLRVDASGRTWVRRHPATVADTARTAFEVFDSAGAYLGPVSVPLKLPEFGLQAWTRNGLVAIIEDDDGRPTVVRFRFQVPDRP